MPNTANDMLNKTKPVSTGLGLMDSLCYNNISSRAPKSSIRSNWSKGIKVQIPFPNCPNRANGLSSLKRGNFFKCSWRFLPAIMVKTPRHWSNFAQRPSGMVRFQKLGLLFSILKKRSWRPFKAFTNHKRLSNLRITSKWQLQKWTPIWLLSFFRDYFSKRLSSNSFWKSTLQVSDEITNEREFSDVYFQNLRLFSNLQLLSEKVSAKSNLTITTMLMRIFILSIFRNHEDS